MRRERVPSRAGHRLRSIVVAGMLLASGAGGAAASRAAAAPDGEGARLAVLDALFAEAADAGDAEGFARLLAFARGRWPVLADRLEALACAHSVDWPAARQAAELACGASPGSDRAVAAAEGASHDDPSGNAPEKTVGGRHGKEGEGGRKRLKGSLDLGASLSSGDTRERAFSGRLRMAWRTGEAWSQELALDGDLARRAGATSQQRLNGDFRLFYRGFDHLYLFNFMRGEYDRFGGFEWRVTESVGLGYSALRGPRHEWRLEGGPGIRFIALAGGPGMEREPIARLSSEYRLALGRDWKLENDSAAFLGGEGITLENTVALEGRINASLFGRVSFYTRYDTRRLAGPSKLDTLSKFSLGYRF